MSSTTTSRATRERQLARAETELKALGNRLRSEGADDKAVARNPKVRALRAAAAHSRRQIKAIDGQEALGKELADKKAAKLEAKKAGAGKKKKKKKVEQAPPAKKKKKETKAKK